MSKLSKLSKLSKINVWGRAPPCPAPATGLLQELRCRGYAARAMLMMMLMMIRMMMTTVMI